MGMVDEQAVTQQLKQSYELQHFGPYSAKWVVGKAWSDHLADHAKL